MTRAPDDQEELRRNALTAFLDERVREGYQVETRTDTHAIIAPADRFAGSLPPDQAPP